MEQILAILTEIKEMVQRMDEHLKEEYDDSFVDDTDEEETTFRSTTSS